MKKTMIYGSMSMLMLAACNSASQEADTPEITEEEPDQQQEQPEEVEEPTEEIDPDDSDEQEDSEEVVEEVEPEYEINDVIWTVDPLEDANPEVVLATFDDAPDKHAVEMAQTLKENNVQAIFFVNGHFLNTDEEKEKLKEIHNMGFPIGNHTMTHQDLKSLSEEEQYEEIVEVSDTVEEIIGERPRFFRAPFGSNTDYSKELVAEEGMTLMNWTYGYDWESEYQDADALADIMVNSEFLQNGANLLMHDRDWTNEALPTIIDGLREQGYEFVDPDLIK
ncbi:polysaccharide deacetylase family protein [Alkalicoccobacillus plakortidis]|uniref:Polysaccharide deacetylase family protein n=1 Tax=Alkalicoccobacillus plakortidis TaxID=444060 RepID=A0ABT0XG32_9BACI|nr:polysaccharide deacetylase family protein [Alkalicoccobacillus plakortidis]MCM2674866.1 polysaccharide deacetylase family protein [Alkalicoccobacillus plakortidis]